MLFDVWFVWILCFGFDIAGCLVCILFFCLRVTCCVGIGGWLVGSSFNSVGYKDITFIVYGLIVGFGWFVCCGVCFVVVAFTLWFLYT